MKKLISILAIFVLLIAFNSTAMAQGGDRGVQAPPPEATVVVDCLAGDTIFDALKTPAVLLTIVLDGMCTEDVTILRSKVILKGIDETLDTLDGIMPKDDNRVLTLSGTNAIVIEYLTLRGGRFGLSINSTFSVLVRNTSIEDAAFGVIAGSASGSINFIDTHVFFTPIPDDAATPEINEAIPLGITGIWATNGSNVRCTECDIDTFKTGIRVSQGSEAEVWGTTVQNTRTAVSMFGARFVANDGCSGDSCTRVPSVLDGNTSLALEDNSSALIRRSIIYGQLSIYGKSILAMAEGTHQANFGSNNVRAGSSVVVYRFFPPSTFERDFIVGDFSNLTLPSGSKIDGELVCLTGADAYCGTSSDVTNGSNCTSCQP